MCRTLARLFPISSSHASGVPSTARHLPFPRHSNPHPQLHQGKEQRPHLGKSGQVLASSKKEVLPFPEHQTIGRGPLYTAALGHQTKVRDGRRWQMSCWTLEPQGRDEKLWALTSMLELSQHQSAGCPGPWPRTVPYPTPSHLPQLQDLTQEAPDCPGHSSWAGCTDAWATCVTHVHQHSARADLVLPLGAPESRLSLCSRAH